MLEPLDVHPAVEAFAECLISRVSQVGLALPENSFDKGNAQVQQLYPKSAIFIPVICAVAWFSNNNSPKATASNYRSISDPAPLLGGQQQPIDCAHLATMALNATQLPHPFYPIEANIVGYLANQWSVATLLGLFASGWVVILGTTMALLQRHNPYLPSMEKATILWFVLSE